jgi:hypothetical protein
VRSVRKWMVFWIRKRTKPEGLVNQSHGLRRGDGDGTHGVKIPEEHHNIITGARISHLIHLHMEKTAYFKIFPNLSY